MPAVAEQVEIATKYAGYIERQQDEIERQRAQEDAARCRRTSTIATVRGLSTEVQQKLNQHRPETIGQARAHLGHHAGGDLAAAGAPEARLRRRRRRPQRDRATRSGGRHDRRPLGLTMASTQLRDARRSTLPPAARDASSRAYLALLAKWNRTYNLTAIREPERMVTHHLLDALAVLPHLPQRARLRVLDVGTGGGCPAFRSRSRARDWRVTLLDCNHKKAAFLRQAVIELGLANVER